VRRRQTGHFCWTASGEKDGNERQIDGHGQVLEHQDRQYDWGLGIVEPAELSENSGDDAGGRDVGQSA